MRRSHQALLIVAMVFSLGLVGLQLWMGERQRARQQEAFARHQAALAAWRAQSLPQPGQLQRIVLPPPPFVPPPPVFPWLLAYVPLLTITTVIAAAEQQRVRQLQQREEEDLTPYSEAELMDNWEFKIVRCPGPLFDQPAFLDKVLREEAVAGWQLVEKFDGMRVRLKRVAGQHSQAELPPGYDPYRTTVGPPAKVHLVLWVCCGLCLLLLPFYVLLQTFDPIATAAFWALVGVTATIALVLGIFAVRQTAKYRERLALTTPAGLSGR